MHCRVPLKAAEGPCERGIILHSSNNEGMSYMSRRMKWPTQSHQSGLGPFFLVWGSPKSGEAACRLFMKVSEDTFPFPVSVVGKMSLLFQTSYKNGSLRCNRFLRAENTSPSLSTSSAPLQGSTSHASVTFFAALQWDKQAALHFRIQS